jgi:hypothetical protein
LCRIKIRNRRDSSPMFPRLRTFTRRDIRFVMVELGKLGTKVDRLIQDVDRQGTKIDAVWHQISFVKGALWVLGGLFAIATVAVPIYFRMTNALYFRMTNALTRL